MESKIVNSIDEVAVNFAPHLNSDAPIFLQIEWFRIFERYILTKSQQPKIVICNTSEDNIGFLPFYSETGKSFLGKKILRGMTNYYSCMFSLVSLGRIKSNITELANCRLFFGSFDEIHLNLIYEDDVADYITFFEQLGLKCFTYTDSYNWYHDDIDCFDTFYSRCSKNMRNNIRRAKVKLEKEGEYEITITCLDDLEVKLKDYHSVYEDSWKHEESHPEFINQIAKIAANQNQLRLGVAYHKSEPVAAQLWFIDKNCAYIFKLAYRESYASTSIGNILTMDLCKHTIEQDGVVTVDFLTGNDGYKGKWMTKSRKQIGLKITNPKKIMGLSSTIRENLSLLKKRITAKKTTKKVQNN